MMGLQSFSFFLSLLAPFSIFQDMIQKYGSMGEKMGFQKL
jgi:hypothetical protein